MDRQQRDRRGLAGASSCLDHHVVYVYPTIEEEKYCVTNVDYMIRKLWKLVSDPVTSDQVTRISRLLDEYLHEIGDEGYPIKHLPAVMQMLEFLAQRSAVDDYEAYFDRMLQLCSRPPLLERSSESLVSSDAMERYFTLLGELLMFVPHNKQRQQICDAINCLLIDSAKLPNIAAVKMEFRHRAVENSQLPIIIVKLLQNAKPKVYPIFLEVASVLASVSHQCCYRMLQADILNTLLTRMDLPYATQMYCIKPPEASLEGEEYPWDTMIVITNLLWNLMKSILPSRMPPKDMNLPLLKQCAMWGLRYSFKQQIVRGEYCSSSVKIRNDIAALILAGIIAFPSWNLASSGIAEDIVNLLSAIDSGSVNIWTNNVKFFNNEEDFFFKRILLIIIGHLADTDVYIFIMKKALIIPIILRIIRFCIIQIDKKHRSILILFEHAMYILSRLAAPLATDIIKYKGTQTLCTMIEISKANFDECFVIIVAGTICSIIQRANTLLTEDFRKNNMISLLIDLINIVLGFDKLTIRRQRILTLLLLDLDCLLKNEPLVEQYGIQGVEIVKTIFTKCLYQKSEDFQVDQRFFLMVGSYTWGYLVPYPDILQRFLKAGGLYFVLDIIEIASFPIKCLYLGMLTDICDYTFCGPLLCTWRSIDKKTGSMSLFASIWRQEEDRVGIKRLPNGCIEDLELPQMGTQQRFDTYRSKLMPDKSPTIVDMLGSVRSKIFGIVKIIERDQDKYDIAENHYKILIDKLPIEDRITLCCVDMYFRLKLGQMWIELSKYLIQEGIAPLIMDAHLITHMVQWHRSWGILIEEQQRKIVMAAKRAETFLEMETFKKLYDSTLAPTLDALKEVDHIRRTTDRYYMLQQKKCQREQVNKTLSFPHDADTERCHRTYSDKTNVTVILGQHQTIESSQLKDLTYDLMELFPVTPSNSSQKEIFANYSSNILNISNDILLEKQFTEGYFIESFNQ